MAFPITAPLAAITSFPKILERSIAAVPVLLEVPKFVSLNSNSIYLFVPFIRLYPPLIDGSKFCSCSAEPGGWVKGSLLRTNPPSRDTICC